MNNDTSPNIEMIFDNMMNLLTNTDKLKLGFSMFESTKKIVLSTIKDKENWRVSLFLRFYDNDFDEITKKKIVNTLKKIKN